jgi:hypothetical protein
MPKENDRNQLLTVALAEFQALRGEILQRIQIQQVLLGLTVTTLGVLLSVALSEKSSARLLLAAPFVASALGFAYSDQSRRINLLGAYIRGHLWQRVESVTDPNLSSWERFFARAFETPFQAFLTSAYIVGLFVLFPIALDCYAGAATDWDFTSGQWALFGSGLATTMLFSAYALAVALRYGIVDPKSPAAEAS